MSLDKHLDELSRELVETIKKKNHDYGNSFERLFNKIGLDYAVIRQMEKTDRLESLVINKNLAQVSDESVEDTFRDIAGYALLTLATLEESREDEKKEAQLKGKFPKEGLTAPAIHHRPVADTSHNPQFDPQISTFFGGDING